MGSESAVGSASEAQRLPRGLERPVEPIPRVQVALVQPMLSWFLVAIGATALWTWCPIYMPSPGHLTFAGVPRHHTHTQEHLQAIQELSDQIFSP